MDVTTTARLDVADPQAWPAGTPAGIRRYLAALDGDGPSRLCANAAGVTGEVWRVGEAVLPVLVSDGRPGKAAMLSPLAHHVLYPLHEIGRRGDRRARLAARAVAAPLRAVLAAGAIDRALFVNHWLATGAPDPGLSAEAWRALAAALARRHPRHAIVVQDVKPARMPGTARALRAAGAAAIPTRTVYVFDPARPLVGEANKQLRYKRNRAKRIAQEAAARLAPPEAVRRRTDRLADLYRHSNIERHAALNPRYAPAFFDLALDCPAFEVRAWHGAGDASDRIVAFGVMRVDARGIHWTAFGAEPDGETRGALGKSLYEQVLSSNLAVALDRGLTLDWGGGSDEFKRTRGAAAVAQDEMVLADHLPARQRAAWRLLARLRTARRRQLEGDRAPS